MSLVLDSSVTLAWLHADEGGAGVEAVFAEVLESGAHVPGLWHLEVANSLAMAVRRGRISASFKEASLQDLAKLEIVVDPDTDRYAWTVTVNLADRHRLTVYDAAYLELARRLAVPLATLDQDLRIAAADAGVRLLGRADDRPESA